MKKFLISLSILFSSVVFFATNLNAAQLPPLDIYVKLNGTNIFFENTGDLQGDPDNPYSNIKSLPAGTEMSMVVTLNDYKSLVGRYLVAIDYCSTAYPSLGNVATPGTPDFINSTFIANYSTTTAGVSCKVGEYTGSTYKAVYAINRSVRLADNFGIRIWGGTTFDYVTWFKINSVSVYDYTPDVENSFQNIKNQQDLENKLNNLNNSQQETNTKLEDLNKKQEETNNQLKDLNGNITDSTGPDTSALENSAGWLPAGPVDSILNLPLALFNNLTSNLSKTCQPVSLPLPFLNKNLELPCLNTIFSKIEGLSTWLNIVGGIASAFILFHYLIGLYKWVDDTLSFRENNYMDNWGGI